MPGAADRLLERGAHVRVEPSRARCERLGRDPQASAARTPSNRSAEVEQRRGAAMRGRRRRSAAPSPGRPRRRARRAAAAAAGRAAQVRDRAGRAWTSRRQVTVPRGEARTVWDVAVELVGEPAGCGVSRGRSCRGCCCDHRTSGDIACDMTGDVKGAGSTGRAPPRPPGVGRRSALEEEEVLEAEPRDDEPLEPVGQRQRHVAVRPGAARDVVDAHPSSARRSRPAAMHVAGPVGGASERQADEELGRRWR